MARAGGWQRTNDVMGTARSASVNIYPDGTVAMEPRTSAVPLRNDMSAAQMADAELLTHYGQRFWDAMSAEANAIAASREELFPRSAASSLVNRRATDFEALDE